MKIKRAINTILLFCTGIILAQTGADSTIIRTIEFSFTGDIMCHSTQFKFAQVGKDTFNFNPVYREIKPYLSNSDIVVGNLETVIQVDSLRFSGYPVFNTPKDFLIGLKFAGFDILSTANNHAYDIRERGIKSTIKYSEKYGLKNIGTYLSQAARDSVIIMEKNGIKFSILSYTYGVNLYKIPEDKSYLVNRINSEIIKNDIKKSRTSGAELVILFFHFGTEYQREANNYQKGIVKEAISNGADIIIGSHPHTLQQVEFFKSNSGNIDSGFVAYSLGNFVSNQRWRYSDGGAVLNFTVQKNKTSGKLHLSEVRYLPIWVFKGLTKNGNEYIILPTSIISSGDIPKYLSEDDLRLIKECEEDTKLILNNTRLKIDNMKKSNLRKLIRNYNESIVIINNMGNFGTDDSYLRNYPGSLNPVDERYKKIFPHFE